MADIAEASLPSVVEALREAGYEPAVRAAPSRRARPDPRPAAWIPVPGEEAYIVVAVAEVVPGDRPGTWHPAHSRAGIWAVTGYQVAFHERPFRTRGHPYADGAAYFHSVFVDEVLATVRDWADWEATWSVIPTVEPEGRRTARLRRLAATRTSSASIPVDVELDPLTLALLDRATVTDLHRTLDELFLPGIRWRFPRDRVGTRLAARAQVLLREYARPAHPSGKGLWLVVDGPEPRGEQRLTVRLARAAGRSSHHRWDGVPEYWRPGPRTLEELWGVDRDAAPADEAASALTAGRTLDALRVCGVATDRGVDRLLSGLPDRFELREWTDRWVANAITTLAGAAPWLWPDAVAPKRRPQRLESLGGFNPNRRPGLFLEHRDGRPHLSFDQSASPLVLPRPRWQRDVDFDLVRLGLLTRDRIPMP